MTLKEEVSRKSCYFILAIFSSLILYVYNENLYEGYLEGESTERIEKRYLASFSVPFLTIYQEGKVEGVFRLDTPPLNFGYENVASILARSDAMAASSAAEDLVSFDEAPPTEVDPSITGTVISSLSFAAKALADCWKKRFEIQFRLHLSLLAQLS